MATKMIVTKRFTFEASHQLGDPFSEEDKKLYGGCWHNHGHSYKLFVSVRGRVNDSGFVVNFKDIKAIVNPLIDELDHTFLNQHTFFKENLIETTAENLLKLIYSRLKRRIELSTAIPKGCHLHSLVLWETETCYAEMICN